MAYLADGSILSTIINATGQAAQDISQADPNASGVTSDIQQVLNDIKGGAVTQQAQNTLAQYGGSNGMLLIGGLILLFLFMRRR